MGKVIKKIQKYFGAVYYKLYLVLPAVLAYEPIDVEISPGTTGEITPGATGEITPGATGDIFQFKFKPPAGLPKDIETLLYNITGFLMVVATPLAAIFYIWAAFLYLTSAGNEKKIQTANRAVLYTTIGLGVVLASRGLALIIKDALTP